MTLWFCHTLGVPSPVIAPYVGRTIVCSREGSKVVGPYGFEIGTACLPVYTFTALHEEILQEGLIPILAEAGLHSSDPRGIFTTLIPVATLMAPGAPPAVIADLALDVALPPAVVTSPAATPAVHLRAGGSAARGRREDQRVLLFDLKSVQAGSTFYFSTRATDHQAGAVVEREHRVQAEYERHAKRLDSRFTPRPPPGSPPGTPAPTPILDRLRSFTRVRALVLGGYGEASVDVHHLLDVCADRIAAANWQYQGARTMVEYRGYIINRLRRRLSLIVARAYTRYILRRLAMVGVPNPGAVRAPQPMPVPRQTGLEAEFFAAQVWEAPPDDLW